MVGKRLSFCHMSPLIRQCIPRQRGLGLWCVEIVIHSTPAIPPNVSSFCSMFLILLIVLLNSQCSRFFCLTHIVTAFELIVISAPPWVHLLYLYILPPRNDSTASGIRTRVTRYKVVPEGSRHNDSSHLRRHTLNSTQDQSTFNAVHPHQTARRHPRHPQPQAPCSQRLFQRRSTWQGQLIAPGLVIPGRKIPKAGTMSPEAETTKIHGRRIPNRPAFIHLASDDSTSQAPTSLPSSVSHLGMRRLAQHSSR